MPCGRADRGVRPYGWSIDGAVCGGTHGSRPTRHFCRAGPACPAGGAGKTRSGRCRHRPLRRVARSACVRADVGSELSAAGGRGSEVSEWPRSKLGASAVRQRKNFGHRNRIIGPYGGLQGVPCGRADRGVRPYGWGIDGAVCGGTHGSRTTGRFCRAGPACPAGGAVQGQRVGFIECVLSS